MTFSWTLIGAVADIGQETVSVRVIRRQFLKEAAEKVRFTFDEREPAAIVARQHIGQNSQADT